MASTGTAILLGAGVVAALLLARNHAQLDEELGVLQRREQTAVNGGGSGGGGRAGSLAGGTAPYHGAVRGALPYAGGARPGGSLFYLRVDGQKPARLFDLMTRRDRMSLDDLLRIMTTPNASTGGSAGASWGLKAAAYDAAGGHVWATMETDASAIVLEPAAGWTTWLLVSK